MTEPAEPALGVGSSLSGRRWVWRNGEDRIAFGIAQRLGVPEIVGRLLAARGIDLDDRRRFPGPDLARAAARSLAARRHGCRRRAHRARGLGRRDGGGVRRLRRGRRLQRRADGELPARARLHRADPRAGPPDGRLRPERAGAARACRPGRHAGRSASIAAPPPRSRLPCWPASADVVVLDHHKAEGPPPPVVATVNPNRLDCGSGLHHLCAAAVAFLTSVATLRALRRTGFFRARPEPDLLGLLDLVALATVCDVMPLTGLNRALVAQGLKVMARRRAARHRGPARGGRSRASAPTPSPAASGSGRASTPPGASARPISACACCCATTRWRRGCSPRSSTR